MPAFTSHSALDVPVSLPITQALPSSEPLPVLPIEHSAIPVAGDEQSAAALNFAESDPVAVTRELPDVETTRVWGLDFAVVDMQTVLKRVRSIISIGQPRYFVTANLNYVMLSQQQAELAKVNRSADLMIADGFPIVWRSLCTAQRLPERVAGSDMIVQLGELAAKEGYRVFFLGAAPGVAQKAADKLVEMFPALQVAGCVSPPFRDLEPAEHTALLEQIRAAQPDILLVAFGQPKGERWIFENYQQLAVPLSIQLGASFDFLAGTARRAPRFWQAIGCEWLYRSLCEPRRLAPRYFRNIVCLLRNLCDDLRLLVQ